MARNVSRRSVVAGSGIAITGLLVGGSQVAADGHEIPVRIDSINTDSEVIVMANEGDEDVDISGYIVSYLCEGEPHEEDTVPDGAVIEAGGELTFSTVCTDIGADLPLGDPIIFGDCEFYDETGILTDTVVLLSPDGNTVDMYDIDWSGVEFGPGETEEETEEDSKSETGEGSDENGSDVEETEGGTGDKSEDGSADEESDETEEDEESNGKEEEDPSAGIREYETTLTGEAHGVETDASGSAYFEGDSEGGEIAYTLSVDICNVTQAHIHLGGEDKDGPVVAWLYPDEGQEPDLVEGRYDGVLVRDTLTENDLVGDWEGASIGDVMAVLDEEEAYVNVHTEEYPGGEIRGQIGLIDSL